VRRERRVSARGRKSRSRALPPNREPERTFRSLFPAAERIRYFICIGTAVRPLSRTMKLHFRKSNRGPGASSQLHCLYECANNGTTHFLREYILTISDRSRTCRQANTRGASTVMYGSTCIKSTNPRLFRIGLTLLSAPPRNRRLEIADQLQNRRASAQIEVSAETRCLSRCFPRLLTFSVPRSSFFSAARCIPVFPLGLSLRTSSRAYALTLARFQRRASICGYANSRVRSILFPPNGGKRIGGRSQSLAVRNAAARATGRNRSLAELQKYATASVFSGERPPTRW